MNLTQLNKKTIALITGAISIIIDKNHVLPIMSSVGINDNNLTFSDIEVSLTLKNIGLPGRACIWSEDLKKVLKVMPEFYLDINEVHDGNITTTFISPDKSEKLNFTGFNYDDYIKVPSSDKLKVIGKMGDSDVKHIKIAAGFVSKDALRPSMTNVAISQGHIVATDANVLYFEPTELAPKKDLLLSKKVVAAIDLIHSENDPLNVEMFNYKVDSSDAKAVEYYRIWNSVGELIFRDVDEKYPNWPAVVPQDQHVQFVISKVLLMPVLEKALMQANQTTHQSKFKLDSNGLNISSEDIDFQRDYSKQFKPNELTIDFDGDSFQIGFNVKFLQRALSVCTDPVSFKMSAPNRAAIINGNVLVMPVMLNV